MASTVLITGATGLLGGWTLRHWERGQFIPNPIQREQCDLLQPGAACEAVRQVEPAAVIHLAWVASGTPGYRDSPANDRWLETSIAIAEACQETGALLYCTGSVVDDQVDGSDRYTRAKSVLREVLREDIARGRVGWFRPHYVFDPESRRPGVVAQALDALAAGKPVVLSHPDDEHDFIHASDVGHAIALAVAKGLRGTIDIGCGRRRPVKELVERLGATWSPASSPLVEPCTTEVAHITALTTVGWTPTRTEEFFTGD